MSLVRLSSSVLLLSPVHAIKVLLAVTAAVMLMLWCAVELIKRLCR